MKGAILDALVAIAAEAARVVKAIYATPFEVEYKGPADPVTLADRQANDLICERLQRDFPGIPIVAEESPVESFAGFRDSREIFFVDPVDGTNEFIERRPEFVVMIGLVQGDRPTHAVIHAPVFDEAWAGAVGDGAFRIGSDGARSPIRVSEVTTLAEARLVSSRSHRSERLERLIAALGVKGTVPLGSAGLKGVEVARGGAEAYVAPFHAGKRWDVCAAEAIVNAAGGRVTDASGTLLDYRGASLSNDLGVVASNGHVHDQLVARLHQIRASGA